MIDEKEARTLLSDLIGIDSVNPSLVPSGKGEQSIAEYILGYLKSLGIEARLDPVAPGRPNVIGLLSEDGDGGCPGGQACFESRHGLMLNGHIDTVGTAGMAGDPLKAQFDGDKVYGRGAHDMKGGLVAGLLAMAATKRSRKKLRRSVLFTGVVDEEYASIGTEDVARRYKADAAIIMEPTNLNLVIAHKGFAWVTVEVYGKAAHGSRFEEGIDAIAQMGKVLVEVDRLGKRYLQESTHPLVGPRSIHASLIQGGKELSTYPDYCKAQLERRTIPGEDPAGIVRELEQICARLASEDPSFRARVTLNFTRNAYEISKDAPIVKTLVSSVASVMGREPAFAGGAGWMDSALLGDAGIPTVIFGPGGQGSHAAEEYVTMSSILNAAMVLADTIERFCGA